MYDAVSIGELLVDFTPIKLPGHKNPCFEQHPGGAPANVVCALSKLGHNTAFIGKVGDDQFGHFCRSALKSFGVDTGGLLLSPEHPTALAFVHLKQDGDRDFSFYRRGMADTSLRYEEIDRRLLHSTRLFHFGSVSTTDEPSRCATFKCAIEAKEKGACISYDPNLRPPLWGSLEAARQTIIESLPLADIVKLSEEEALFISGIPNPEKAARMLSEKYAVPLVLVSMGSKGCIASVGGRLYSSGAYTVKAVDTTGAGDFFLAGILHRLLKYDRPIKTLGADQITSMLAYANAIGAIAATKRGAMSAIPTPDEIEKFMWLNSITAT